MALPANVGKGTVVGILTDSNGQPLTGKVTLRPRFTAARVQTAVPPVTILPQPVVVTLPTAPEPTGEMPPTEVIATDDPDLGLDEWTYQVSFKFDSGVEYGPFDIAVPEGETVDLTLVAPAASVDGVQIMRGFGVPDTSTAVDGDVVTYDEDAGATAWWSRADALGAALDDEFADPESPVHDAINNSLTAVTDEALASRLSRVDRTRHAESLGLYFPEAEGATGDGTDDTAALQATFELAPAGSVVHLRTDAEYRIAAGVNATGLTVQLNGSVIKAADQIVAPNLLETTGSLSVVGPGIIDGNKETTTDPGTSALGCGIYAAQAAPGSNVWVSNVEVKNCWKRGISIASSVGAITNAADAVHGSVAISDSEVSGCGSYGVFVAEIIGPQVRNVFSHHNQNGFLFQVCDALSLSNCRANDNGSDGVGQGVAILYCRDAKLSSVTANNNAQSGIAFGGGSVNNTPNVRGTITGHTCNGNAHSGISIDPTILGQNGVPVPWGGTIAGGTCSENGLHGINLTAVLGASITGNACDKNLVQGLGIAAAGVAIDGNHAHGNGAFGLALFGSASDPDYGDHVIGTNHLVGNASGALSCRALVQSQFGMPAMRSDLKASQTVNNSDTLVSSALSIPVDANARYEIQAFLAYNSSQSADIKFNISLPGSGLSDWSMVALDRLATSGVSQVARGRYNQTVVRSVGGSGGNAVAEISGTVTIQNNPGVVGIQFAQFEPEASDTTLLANSWLKLTRIG